MSRTIFPSINGLRALSIIFVVFHHLNFFNDPAAPVWLKCITDFIQDGHLGVNIFFVISGFLITSLLIEEEYELKTISLKNFYIRRTLRIFPAYYFLLLVYFILQLFHIIQISNESWLTAITYTKYFNWNLDWITAHAWSLSVEEHFYLFWPIVFICGEKIRIKMTIALIIIAPIMRVYSYHNNIWQFDNTLFTRIDAIAIGCLFAFYKDEIKMKMNNNWQTYFSLSILGIFLLPYLPYYLNKIHLGYIVIPLGLTHGTISNFLIAIIIMYSVFGPQKLWFRILNLKIINKIGVLSYSIYLWQQIFISDSKYWVTKFPQNIIFILIMAIISYNLIERPFIKLKSRFSENDLKIKKTV